MVRTALITGAGRRIGREIAIGLAKAGYKVAIHYNKSKAEAIEAAELCESVGSPLARAIPANLESSSDRTLLLTNACDALGVDHIDLLVNSASLFEYDNADSFCKDKFSRHVASNFVAPVELTFSMLDMCKRNDRKGHVITFLDQKVRNLNVDYASYTLSKLATYSSIRFLAQVSAPLLRVNAVAPGLTMLSGDMTHDDFEDAKLIAALGQSNSPADLLAAVLYLDAAPSVTGQSIVVDGGQHLVPRNRDVAFGDS